MCAAGPKEPCGGRGSTAKRCAAGLECVKRTKGKKANSEFASARATMKCVAPTE
uniref:Uncharacterized protein n=1 Tax=Anguilla anguilla TaxID=7936 RepID=A0A0E9XFU5_ANGAN